MKPEILVQAFEDGTISGRRLPALRPSHSLAVLVNGEVTAVLAEGPIQTALDAVRASILAEGDS